MPKEKEIETLKKNTIKSAFSLFFQSGYSAVLGFIASLVLTIVLSPSIFGMYITVLSIISLLNYFSDVGLAASLIQKKEITDHDVTTTFTIQQSLIISLILIGFVSTQFVKSFYNLPQQGVVLYWALLAAFFISSLKTIPSVFLERKVEFQKIVMVQIVENTLFYICVISLAILGFGLMSFVFAVMIRAIVGLVLIYSISFWMPRIGVSKSSLNGLLSFGLPFQGSSFLALFKDDLIILFLGKVLGFELLGYIGWAKKWAEAPIRIIMDNISRVLFPVISRLQNEPERISSVIHKILRYQTLLLAPAMVGLAMVVPSIVEFIPKYSKWEPAIPIFYIFCVTAFLSSYSTPFINMFNALGKAKLSFSFMLFWTITTWICTPLFTKLFGLYGFPATQLILALSSIFVIVKARQLLHFEIISSIDKPIILSVIMGAILIGIKSVISTPIYQIIVMIPIGAIGYVGLAYMLFRIQLLTEVKDLFMRK
ncbi:hypothetical protein A2690_04180 [Candidatus Roizmanbacteria bacterium RIFCSPHIGHO2_01_FULL_39_12b]|uniref:Uncharacterized protein n=1 Tax=Candidatus Roizmanbacteria bacterium RIFCSPHIGHO2_01_FULL_39_12b TaxID=1802030 RepID=A0A1F7GC45_9BACT|nr:MAG: hypothetical protein A2690_04180 [Candidatus Roizmanbacteria bacterium RIFCSPHIGHO2_01_FULL_39_12b]OGK47140.1 MAG: hypothetical protein A3B46_01905 [Candidatus Roizmanbacteria bacterium RIFCSPLOWO2_01_FULL_39_19]